jgi:ATP-dependent 26S proteasome regulatory subunit
LVGIAKESEGLSPSDIKMVAIEAMKLSIIDSRNTLTQNDLSIALKKFLSREKLRKTTKGED